MDSTTERNATQIDEGWRAKMNSSESRQATQVDEGWRAKMNGSGSKANSQADSKATQIDEGWRAKGAYSGRKATVVDEGWRKKVANMLDPENSDNKDTPNYFRELEDFQEAVSKLEKLTSSTGEVYPVKKVLSTAGGESVILLCSDPDGNDVVAKVYYEPVNSKDSSVSSRPKVLEYMGTEDGQKYTLAIIEVGTVEFGDSKYYFETTPYIPDGDISDDGAFSFDEVCEITRQLNEAVHSIHKFGIVHTDIKPQNIFRVGNRFILGDFGTAKVVETGKTRATRKIVATDGFAAPELRLGLSDDPIFIYNAKTDYYALGITIACLFEGHFIYDKMDAKMVLDSVYKSKPPLSRVDPRRYQLENLIRGLCKFDAQNRFEYDDVKRWLSDHDYAGGVSDEAWTKSFRAYNSEFRDEKSLFMAITKDEASWEEGKELLYGKYLEEFFRSFRTDLSRAAKNVDEQYRNSDSDKGLSIFLKTLFAPGHIVWKGQNYMGLGELGEKMLSSANPASYGELLKEHVVSHWLANTEGITVDEKTKQLVDDIEAVSISEPEIACYWFGNSFAQERKLSICGKTVSDIPGLINAMFSSPLDFYQGDALRKMLDRKAGADFYGFLYGLGYKDAVNSTWGHLSRTDMFNKASLLMSMMDNIAVKAGADPTIIRSFFLKYGPVGMATYTKQLVEKRNEVYSPLDADGKQAITAIINFQGPASGTVEELFRAYTPLVDSVDKLRRLLTDNPFCIVTGVYETRGVICRNLVGCFGFKVYDRLAPLGFCALIDNAKGGTN